MSNVSTVPWGWYCIRHWQAHDGTVFKIKWSPNGEILATASLDSSVRLWTRYGTLIRELRGHSQGVTGLAWSSDSETLASSSKDQSICIWDVASGDLVSRLAQHANYVFALAWRAHSRTLLSGADDCTIRLWDLNSSQTRVIQAPSKVWALLERPAQELFIAGCSEGELLVCHWNDLQNPQLLRNTGRWSRSGINSLEIVSNFLVVATNRGILIKNLDSWDDVSSIDSHKGSVSTLALSNTTAVLASRGYEGTAKLWKIGEWDEIGSVSVGKEPSSALSFHPHSFELVTTGLDSRNLIMFKLDEQIAAGLICRHKMLNDRLCGRPALDRTGNIKTPARCAYHTPNHVQSQHEQAELTQLLSTADPTVNIIDCSGYIFDSIPPLKTIYKNVCFDGAQFTGSCDFSHVTFEGSVSFRNTQFRSDCKFNKCRFLADVVFEGARFSRLFANDATFGGSVWLQSTMFEKRADFSCSNFLRSLVVTDSTFDGGVFFRDAKLQDVSFVRNRCWQDGDIQAVVDFGNARFDQPENANFRSLNSTDLQGVRMRLVNCNIEQAHFEDVNWHRESGRLVLQDELDIRRLYENKASFELVIVAYRRLMRSYDDARAYDLAEECFRASLEMRVVDRRTDFVTRSTIATYGLASLYGGSYIRAVTILFALVFGVFPIVLAITGVSVDATIVESSGANSFFAGYIAGLNCSLEAVTFVRQGACRTPTIGAWFLQLIERIIVPGQLALALLALSRRLRR
jgi:WD40 repeat protein